MEDVADDDFDDADFAFAAEFGNVLIRGLTFEGVAEALIERGFDMSRAVGQPDGSLRVPHSKPRRAAAIMTYAAPGGAEQSQPEPEPEPVRDNTPDFMPGIKTRACGAVHSDGVVCFIPVLYEPLHCGCSDMVYPHEQPHEAVDDNGVRYRWEEILVIQDLPFDAYSESVSA